MTETIEVDQFIAKPPAEVWKAITTPELFAKWWAPGDVKAEVGHQFTIDMGGWGHQPCTVLEVDEPNRFVYSFADHWTLSFTLVAEGTGTRLLFVHAGFRPDDPQDRFALDNMRDGWGETMEKLAAVA